ncbi:MAG: hypothetical protein ACE37D_19965, partial [Pseudomonadales bacterium]
MKVIDKTLSQAGLLLVASLILASCVNQPQQPAESGAEDAKSSAAASPPKPDGDMEEPSAEVKQEPSAEDEQEPSAEVKQKPSAEDKQEPSAKEEPSAAVKQEPSAKEEPSADTTDHRTETEQTPVPTDDSEPEDNAPGMTDSATEFDPDVAAAAVRDLCERIGRKLGSVKPEDCFNQPLVHGGTSTNGLSLAYR